MHAFVDLLPTPWRGFMMAGFAAAYMSTIGTQLNWGASYIVNDFYKRFLRADATERTTLRRRSPASRLIALFLGSIVVTAHLTSIEQAWKYLFALGAGTGLVLILRWYWWRINAWSEISAMIASLVTSLAAFALIPQHFRPGDPNADACIMLVTVAVHDSDVWLAFPVTYASPLRSRQRCWMPSTGGCDPAGVGGVRSRSAPSAPRNRSRRDDTPGSTGSRGSSRPMRRCSGSGSSSSATATSEVLALLALAAVAFACVDRPGVAERIGRRLTTGIGPPRLKWNAPPPPSIHRSADEEETMGTAQENSDAV